MDCRRLRKFEDKGRAFASWLRTAAGNLAIEKRRREMLENGLFWTPEDEELIPGATPDAKPEDKVVAQKVREIIYSFGEGLCLHLLVDDAAGGALYLRADTQLLKVAAP